MCCARGNHSGKQKNELLTDLPERLRGFTATDVRLSVFRESLGASASNGFRDFEACAQPMLGILQSVCSSNAANNHGPDRPTYSFYLHGNANVKELIDSGPTVIVFLLDSLSEESLALVAMPTIRYLTEMRLWVPVCIGYMSVEPAFKARPRPSNFEEQDAAVNACVDISTGAGRRAFVEHIVAAGLLTSFIRASRPMTQWITQSDRQSLKFLEYLLAILEHYQKAATAQIDSCGSRYLSAYGDPLP